MSSQGGIILFLHGLESGPNGRKVKYLRTAFSVVSPDLEMSLGRLDKSNSLARSILEVAWSAPMSLFLAPRSLASQAVRKSLKKCANVAFDGLSSGENHIQLVCGSSWGGAVALWLMAEARWTGPAIVVAPALKRSLLFGNHPDAIETELLGLYSRLREHQGRVLIIHGTNDDTIPLQDSRELSKETGFELIEVLDGDHSLNSYLIDQNRLVELINRLLLHSPSL